MGCQVFQIRYIFRVAWEVYLKDGSQVVVQPFPAFVEIRFRRNEEHPASRLCGFDLHAPVRRHENITDCLRRTWGSIVHHDQFVQGIVGDSEYRDRR